MDDEEIVFDGGGYALQVEILRQDHRPRELSKKALGHEHLRDVEVDVGALALAGDGEDIARGGDVDVLHADAGDGRDDRDRVLRIENVERDLTDLHLGGMRVVVDVDGDLSVRAVVVVTVVVVPLVGFGFLSESEHRAGVDRGWI